MSRRVHGTTNKMHAAIRVIEKRGAIQLENYDGSFSEVRPHIIETTEEKGLALEQILEILEAKAVIV